MHKQSSRSGWRVIDSPDLALKKNSWLRPDEITHHINSIFVDLFLKIFKFKAFSLSVDVFHRQMVHPRAELSDQNPYISYEVRNTIRLICSH